MLVKISIDSKERYGIIIMEWETGFEEANYDYEKELDMPKKKNPPKNSIMVLRPYWGYSTWVFDDPNTGLVAEAFVSGIPEILDRMLTEKGIDVKEARKTGFALFFGASEFPGYQLRLRWAKEEHGGNWYSTDDGMEGWLCPALFHYFATAPQFIFGKVERLVE